MADNITVQRKITGGAAGAKEGAQAGMTFGPWGALIGGLAGGAMGAIGTEGLTWDEEQRMRRLKMLARRAELGELGLTDSEMAQLEAELIDPERAIMREQQQARLQAMGSQDLGAGAVFQQALGQEAREAEGLAAERRQIARMDEQRKREEKMELRELRGEQKAMEADARKAMIDELTGISDVAGTIGTEVAEGKVTKEEEAVLLDSVGEDMEDFGSFMELIDVIKGL